MMHVITGGSGSGKSAYAEMWLTGKPEKKVILEKYLIICFFSGNDDRNSGIINDQYKMLRE